MSELVIPDVPPGNVPSFRAMLEADGYLVIEEQQPDGLVTLHAQGEPNADVQPTKPWPKPGRS